MLLAILLELSLLIKSCQLILRVSVLEIYTNFLCRKVKEGNFNSSNLLEYPQKKYVLLFSLWGFIFLCWQISLLFLWKYIYCHPTGIEFRKNLTGFEGCYLSRFNDLISSIYSISAHFIEPC